jgi:hypothetical protein
MSDKVILGLPFIALLYPFMTDHEGVTSYPLGDSVKFKFLTKLDPSQLENLQSESIHKKYCQTLYCLPTSISTLHSRGYHSNNLSIQYSRIVETHASDIGYGGILKLKVHSTQPEQTLCSHSGLWTSSQINHSIIQKHVLAIVLCITRFQNDLYDQKFLIRIICENEQHVQNIASKQSFRNCQMFLNIFDFDLQFFAGNKIILSSCREGMTDKKKQLQLQLEHQRKLDKKLQSMGKSPMSSDAKSSQGIIDPFGTSHKLVTPSQLIASSQPSSALEVANKFTVLGTVPKTILSNCS